jgi:hypothetical protein
MDENQKLVPGAFTPCPHQQHQSLHVLQSQIEWA